MPKLYTIDYSTQITATSADGISSGDLREIVIAKEADYANIFTITVCPDTVVEVPLYGVQKIYSISYVSDGAIDISLFYALDDNGEATNEGLFSHCYSSNYSRYFKDGTSYDRILLKSNATIDSGTDYIVRLAITGDKEFPAEPI